MTKMMGKPQVVCFAGLFASNGCLRLSSKRGTAPLLTSTSPRSSRSLGAKAMHSQGWRPPKSKWMEWPCLSDIPRFFLTCLSDTQCDVLACVPLVSDLHSQATHVDIGVRARGYSVGVARIATGGGQAAGRIPSILPSAHHCLSKQLSKGFLENVEPPALFCPRGTSDAQVVVHGFH